MRDARVRKYGKPKKKEVVWLENNISRGRGIVKSRGAGAGSADIASTLPLVVPSHVPRKLELPLAGGLWGWGDKRFGWWPVAGSSRSSPGDGDISATRDLVAALTFIHSVPPLP